MCDYVRARHHRSPSRSEVRRPGLYPPSPAVRTNNNLLLWSSVSDPSRDRVDSFSSTLRHRRNMGELDRRCGIAFIRLAAVQRDAENHQQRSLQETWDQTVAVACDPTIDCQMREAPCRVLGPKSYRTEPPVCTFNQVRPTAFRSDPMRPGQTTCRCSAVPIIFQNRPE